MINVGPRFSCKFIPKPSVSEVKISSTRIRWMTLERCQRCGVRSQLRIKDMREHVRLALMMAMTAMFTLAGYELMRSASTVLFKQGYGAENLPLVMAVMPLVMLGSGAMGGCFQRLDPKEH